MLLDIQEIKGINMIVFQDEFMKTKGKPIEYNDKKIFMIDNFVLPEKTCNLRFNIVSTNSEWKQGFELNLKGSIKVNNQTIKNGTRIWAHTAPKTNDVEVTSKDMNIIITNIWDTGDGVTQKWHNGGALYFEEIENGKRYYCNDGHPDDDFNDIIFELTIV